MTSTEQTLEKFWDMKSRCIATDGEYTDKEMVQILSCELKRSNEESAYFLRAALHATRQAAIEEVREKVENTRILSRHDDRTAAHNGALEYVLEALASLAEKEEKINAK